MRILTPVTVGAFLVVASIFAFAATKIWIKSRTLTALEMPVSLSSGSIDTGPFDINTAGLYSVAIEMQREDRLPLGCKFEVDARQSIRTSGPVLSQKDPTGGQYRWYTIMGHDWVPGGYLGAFNGEPGTYRLKFDVLSDSRCLNAGNPYLVVVASYIDIWRFWFLYNRVCWIASGIGFLGFMLVLVGIRNGIRDRSGGGRNAISSR